MQSSTAPALVGILLASFAQFVAVLLGRAGHGWTEPLLFSLLLWIILPYSVAVAAVGLLESLLTASIVDQMTDTGSDKNRESIGQAAYDALNLLGGGTLEIGAGTFALTGNTQVSATELTHLLPLG